MSSISRENNFDLIRLFASLQVVLMHSYEHLELSSAPLRNFIHALRFFPGVPIFFAISGFLIYASYDRKRALTTYMRARVLRIFPGLWCVFLVTILILVATGFLPMVALFSKQLLIWGVTQVTVFQFYTPEILRNFGVGTPNGSLWTIPIEFSFYLFIPLFFWLTGRSYKRKNILLTCFILLSVAFNFWYRQHYLTTDYVEKRSNLEKLMGLNLVPYLFYFLIGSAIYHNWDKIKAIYTGKGVIWLMIYIAYYLVISVSLKKYSPNYWPNIYGLIGSILLIQATISLAFTAPGLSNKLLKGNDISYGLYLYHMPFINAIIYYNLKGYTWSLILVILASTLFSVCSWRFIEKPALKMKK